MAGQSDLGVEVELHWNQRRALATGRYVPAPKAGSQQVVARFHVVKGSAQGTMGGGKAPLHQYLSQGKGFDRADAPIFNRDGPVNAQQWVQHCLAHHSPHQFRLSLSLPHNPQYFGWRAYVETVMRQTERLVEKPLDWIAAIHRDTDNHHAHIIINGHARGYVHRPGDQAHDLQHRLYLTPDFYKHGMRHLASHIATAWLGPAQTQTQIQEQRPEQKPALRSA